MHAISTIDSAQSDKSVLCIGFQALWCYRFLAALVDNTVLGALQMTLVIFGMSVLFGKALGAGDSGWHKMLALGSLLLTMVVGYWCAVVYHAVQEQSVSQSTVGQRQFGFKVEGPDGHRLTLHNALNRNLWRLVVSPLSVLTIYGAAAFVLPPFPSIAGSAAFNFVALLGGLLILSAIDTVTGKVQTGTPSDWVQSTAPQIGSCHEKLTIRTKRGDVVARAYFGHDARTAVVAIGGCGSGFGSPARGLYGRIANSLQQEGTTTLWLRMRKPAELEEAIHDARAAVDYLTKRGYVKIVLVGHSFSGAAVVTAAAYEPTVSGVILISSQNACTDLISEIAPRPVLVIHGEKDRVIPRRLAEDIYCRIRSQRQLRLFDDGHGLHMVSHAVFSCVRGWLRNHFGQSSLG